MCNVTIQKNISINQKKQTPTKMAGVLTIYSFVGLYVMMKAFLKVWMIFWNQARPR